MMPKSVKRFSDDIMLNSFHWEPGRKVDQMAVRVNRQLFCRRKQTGGQSRFVRKLALTNAAGLIPFAYE